MIIKGRNGNNRSRGGGLGRGLGIMTCACNHGAIFAEDASFIALTFDNDIIIDGA